MARMVTLMLTDSHTPLISNQIDVISNQIAVSRKQRLARQGLAAAVAATKLKNSMQLLGCAKKSLPATKQSNNSTGAKPRKTGQPTLRQPRRVRQHGC